MSHHLVCLTFDFDAISSWIARGMATPTPISRGEFGVVGAERILTLLRQYDISATWFIPGHTIETYPEICRRIHAGGHEIGNHGYTHEPPVTLSPEQEEAVLTRANQAIVDLVGIRPTGYRSPAWDLSPHTVELLLKHGFTYDSSMMGNDYSTYCCRQGDAITPDKPPSWGKLTSLIEMPISWSLDDQPAFEYIRTPITLQPGLRNAGSVLENWSEDFRYMAQTTSWGVLTYTFHPQVTGRGHRMLMLERLIVTLREMGAVFSRLDMAAQEFASWSPMAI
jgi:peptidoglycan/xylan/chitin deacetylase (PgdA/CDA1 family)